MSPTIPFPSNSFSSSFQAFRLLDKEMTIPSLLRVLGDHSDLDAKGVEGETLLHYFSASGWVDGVRFLCQAGVMVNVLDNHKRSPLSLAVCHSHYPVALLLLSFGADPRKAPSHDRLLIRAIEASSSPLVELLLDQGANPNEGNRHGWYSPLAVAVTQPNWSVPVITSLLEAGAHPDTALSHGEVVAHEVARRHNDPGAEEIWMLLLNFGAHMDLPDEKGVSALTLWEKHRSERPYESKELGLKQIKL